jgi:hypothetical protein
MRSKHRKALARGLGNAEVIKRVLEECMQERLARLPEWFALAEKLLDNERPTLRRLQRRHRGRDGKATRPAQGDD